MIWTLIHGLTIILIQKKVIFSSKDDLNIYINEDLVIILGDIDD